ncbi:hypothetical protein J2P12_06580 [Candidatus Bathyarchaeota archaeon]|nr:hypothetical protein [Candidatus Bathyarchaeota archaeon]
MSRARVTGVDSPLVEPGLVAILACPACGLQAPEKPMAEHFLGSPSHRLGLVADARSMVEKSCDFEPAVKMSTEDSRDSLRDLLQILVPPRAFAHRNEHKTIKPVSLLFQSREKSDTGSSV